MNFTKDQVVQNYQGQYARVVEVRGGMVHRTGWLATKAAAEQASAFTFQNAPSLARVLKDSKTKEEPKQETPAEEPKEEPKAKKAK